jgi:hypothetical protein
MAIGTALLYLIALALPLWLLVEEIAHHQHRAVREAKRTAAPSGAATPATHMA